MTHEGLFRRKPLQDEIISADTLNAPKQDVSKKTKDVPSKSGKKDVS